MKKSGQGVGARHPNFQNPRAGQRPDHRSSTKEGQKGGEVSGENGTTSDSQLPVSDQIADRFGPLNW